MILLAPFAPHLAEECWERLGHDESIFEASWPEYDEALAREEQVELVVQINGKVRARLTVPRGLEEEAAFAAALDHDDVQRHLGSKSVRKRIYVPDRLVNIVA